MSQLNETVEKKWQYKSKNTGNWVDCTNKEASERKKDKFEVRKNPKFANDSDDNSGATLKTCKALVDTYVTQKGYTQVTKEIYNKDKNKYKYSHSEQCTQSDKEKTKTRRYYLKTKKTTSVTTSGVIQFESADRAEYIAFRREMVRLGFKIEKGSCAKYYPPNYQRKYVYIKDINWSGCYYRKKESTSVTEPKKPNKISGGGYSDCTGQTRKRGCTDTDGVIAEVQSCIGVKADGKFGPKTETALKNKTGKISFEEEEVEAICTGKPTSGTSGGNTETPEGKRNYWKNLIAKEQIWGKGYIHTTKGGDVVYVFKSAKDDINTKFPLDTLSNADLDKFDYWVQFVIPEGEERGQLGKLVKYTTTNAEEKVKIETNPRWQWEPEEEIESVDIFEVLNRMLKKKIQEQKFYGIGKDDGTPEQGVKTDGGRYYGLGKDDESQGTTGTVSPSKVEGIPTNQTQTQTSTTSSFDMKTETLKEMGDIKQRALAVIDEWDKYNENLEYSLKYTLRYAGKAEVNKQIDLARDSIEDIKTEDYCTDASQKKLNASKAALDNAVKEKGDLLTPEDKKYIARINSIIEEVKTKCANVEKRKNQSLSTSQQGTTQSSSTTPSNTPSTTNPNLTKEDLIKMFGFVGDDGKLIDQKFAIESLGKQVTGVAGKGNLQSIINNSGARSYYFAEYNELVGMVGLGDEYKLKIPPSSTVAAGEIITSQNESLLIPYEDATTKGEFIKETFGNYLGTKSTLPIYTSKRQIADVATSQTKCPFDVAGAKKYLINYIMNGITADMITSPKMTEKQTLCACYKSGAFADFVQGKAVITSDDLGSIPERDKPISMVDKQLKWKEIEDFIRGEKVNGKTINPYFTDRDFGKMSCISPIRESFNRSVKRNISEAIYNKKNVVNGVKNKVLRRINM